MTWDQCKKILCIRADNMGDVIMITPALRALHEKYSARISLLTSSQGYPVCEVIPEIDEVIVADLPWVKLHGQMDGQSLNTLVQQIKSKSFDGAIIFTVYSQSSLPAALLCYQAGIPLRLAYARENPYELLTHWVPDAEPYSLIKHQVRRDLDLVATIGARVKDESLSLNMTTIARKTAEKKLLQAGVDTTRRFVIFHAGVSEAKRSYSHEKWKEIIQKVSRQAGLEILLTGSDSEKPLAAGLKENDSKNVYNIAGLLSVPELIAVIAGASVVLSVNTAIIHIAAAMKTPVVVLYALTNPQHTPWQVPNNVLPFSVPGNLKSKNEVIRFVDQQCFSKSVTEPTPDEVVQGILQLLQGTSEHSASSAPFVLIS